MNWAAFGMTLSADQIPKPISEFLSRTLSSEPYEVASLAGDASSRRYYRIIHGDRSLVLMAWEPFVDADSFPFLNVLRHFHKHHIQVPQVIDFSPEQGLVLLEDLGDLTLERKFWENQTQDLAMPFYELALDELVKIHFTATDDPNPSCVAFDIQFDTAKLLWEMNYGREHLIEKLCHINLSSVTRSELDRIFLNICERLHQQPKRLAHRDYHSRNLMLKLGKMRVIDFQDARLGPVQYDLVSLLYDSYVDLDSLHRERLLNYYLSHARTQSKQDFSREEFDLIMKYQVVQRCFKACGSFSSFYNLRSDKRYLKYIKGTLHTVVDAISELPEAQPFQQVLLNEGLLERDYTEL